MQHHDLVKYKQLANPILSIHNYTLLVISRNDLKVHKIENFFGSEFEFYTISLLVMLKY
jgi:hypothetical protein